MQMVGSLLCSSNIGWMSVPMIYCLHIQRSFYWTISKFMYLTTNIKIKQIHLSWQRDSYNGTPLSYSTLNTNQPFACMKMAYYSKTCCSTTQILTSTETPEATNLVDELRKRNTRYWQTVKRLILIANMTIETK